MNAFILCSKILQNRLYSGTLKYSIFLRNLCGQLMLKFICNGGLKSGVWENSVLFTSCIPVFFYSPRSYMINVLKINCGLLYLRIRGEHRPGRGGGGTRRTTWYIGGIIMMDPRVENTLRECEK